MDAWDVFTVTTLTRDVSDHNHLLINAANNVPRGPIPFRFSSAWCQNNEFLPLMTVVRKNLGNIPLSQKLRILKYRLKLWNKDVFGNVFHAVESATKNLDQIEERITEEGFSEALFQEEIEANKNLEDKLKILETFLRDKDRVQWAKEGDRNSAYYHTLLRVHKAKKTYL